MTDEQAKALEVGETVYHAWLRNRDDSALRARVNGKVRLWKRDPTRYEVPMKHGLKQCFYITPANAGEWLTHDPTERERYVLRACMLLKITLPEFRWDKTTHDALHALQPWLAEALKEILG